MLHEGGQLPKTREATIIRPLSPGEKTEVAMLTFDAGLFSADEIGIVETLVDDYFGGAIHDGHAFLVDDGNDGMQLRGVAYYAPETLTEGTWNLLMLGVHSDFQRQGVGAGLVKAVEEALKADGERLLLVETSSTPDFDGARAFYLKCGYEQEAIIRDYYADGDDMITFRKKLRSAESF